MWPLISPPSSAPVSRILALSSEWPAFHMMPRPPCLVAEDPPHPRPVPPVDARPTRARRAVAGVDHDVDLAREASHPPGDVLLVDGHDGAALDRSPAGLELAGLEAPAQVLDLPAV